MNTCGSCSHWNIDPIDPANLTAPRQGECRCNPPQLIGIPTHQGLQLMVIYPKVPPNFNACANYENQANSKPLSILAEG